MKNFSCFCSRANARANARRNAREIPVRRLAIRPVNRAILLLIVASAGACAGACAGAIAQTQAESPTPATLKAVTITGNPLGTSDLIAPAAQYSGAALLLRSQSTLGETLDGTPGVSSTYFGPNASRPIIRGLDGDRIRILQNSGASIDASGLSYDHAVPSDPISMERIEVLRGPGALLYGGSAVGGVVNVIDNRIPREALFDSKGGITGKADVGLATGNSERGGGLLLETGTDRYALHADVFKRSTGDVSVPILLPCTKTGALSLASKICNSAAQTRGGAVGGSVFFNQGYLGASASTYRSDYGTVAEDEVTIKMKSNRYALEGELRGLGGPLQSIKGQLSRSDYQHTEFDAGSPGTVFKNAGNDLRLEARHAKLGPLDGVVGLQLDNSRFSADGEEAFAPYSNTRQTALFAYEELPLAWGKLSFGARVESVKVASLGNPLVARFTPGSRSFNPGSYALGALWNAAPGWQLTSNLAYTARAPKDYELFADGPHIATGAYEVGNASFATEKSTNLDIGAKWKRGADTFAVSAFVNRFSNYISQAATGVTRDAGGNGAGGGAGGAGVTDDGTGNSVESGGTSRILPEFVFQQVPARFTGLETSGSVRLMESAQNSGQTLDLELRGDIVRAINTATGQPLPRIAPVRLGATLAWAQGAWGARFGVNPVAAQNDVAPGQPVTSAYTLVNASASYRQKAGRADLLWFVRLDNIGDKLAYSATSILTQTAPGKAPLPGRNLKVGLQANF